MYPNKIKEKCLRCYKEKELAIFKYDETKATLCISCLKKHINTLIDAEIFPSYLFREKICPVCERKIPLAFLKYEKVKSNICLFCAKKYIEEIEQAQNCNEIEIVQNNNES